jgi:hypothetical protein
MIASLISASSRCSSVSHQSELYSFVVSSVYLAWLLLPARGADEYLLDGCEN